MSNKWVVGRWLLVVGCWLMVSCGGEQRVVEPTIPLIPATATSAPTLPAPVIISEDVPTVPPTAPIPTATAAPTETPAPVDPSEFETLGIDSVGDGDIPVLLVAGDEGANSLLQSFAQSDLSSLSPYKFWLMPTQADMNWLANADTRFDNCLASNFSDTYPLSNPTAQMAHNIVDSAWLFIEVRSTGDSIMADSCNLDTASTHFAANLAINSGIPSVFRQNETGSWVDYVTSTGRVAVTLNISTGNPQLLSTAVENFSTKLRETIWASPETTSTWQFPQNSFIHPLAIDIHDDTAYVLDSGRVLALSLNFGDSRQLLAEGDFIGTVRVLEPLDLTVSDNGLLVLDRVGDVYRYDFGTESWSIDRYDRPVRDISAHYFFALSEANGVKYLLENSYNFVLAYAEDFVPGWVLPEAVRVDLGVSSFGGYVLSQESFSSFGSLKLYTEGVENGRFSPQTPLTNPRQVVATESAVFVLDHAGHRILKLQPDTGNLIQTYRLATRQPISAIWSDGDQLMLATRDWLYGINMGQGNNLGILAPELRLSERMPNDPDLLNSLRGISMPIGTEMSPRDFQMPGAPRHYRFGIHQGADLYWAVNSPVTATTSGTVIRAMHDYVPDLERFDSLREELRQIGYTTEESADFYRGRQVWIQADNGLITRYAHLSAIDDAIQEGSPVQQGQLIGYIGNSGSPSSRNSEEEDAHLHFELWTENGYVGQFLRPVETRYWLNRLLQ